MSSTTLQTFDIEVLIQGHPWSAKVLQSVDFESAYFSPIVLEVCNVKPTYRKSWVGIF